MFVPGRDTGGNEAVSGIRYSVFRGDISEYEYCGLASDRSRELGKRYESFASDLGMFFLDAGALGLKLGGDGLYFTEEDQRHFAEAIRKKVEGIWEGD